MADVLLPVRSDTSVFEPTGFERLSFVMLSANIITSSAFALWGVKQLDEVLGQNFQQIALDTFHEAELFAARYLPTGLAFLVTLGFAVTGFTFLYALLHTAGFKVCRNGGVIISKGGFVTLIERRILGLCVRLRCVRYAAGAPSAALSGIPFRRQLPRRRSARAGL
ncbi:MAG: hypothetical protein ACLR7U_05735 [Ruthenibacterium lactatiformans]